MSRSPHTAQAKVAGRLSPLALAYAGLFVFSGAAGLTYEVVWSRMLVQVFGVTAFAVSTVLVSFMGGMALGAALLGKWADRARRPLRMFAVLEAGIGLYALVLPFVLGAINQLYQVLFTALPDSFLLRSAIRFVLCIAVLMVPTVLMGGTLPALGQGLLRRRAAIGLGVGLLYFVNTLGAAAGCLLAGFALLPHLGLTRTTLLAAGINGLVAAVAWVLDRRPEQVPAALTERGEEPEPSVPDGPLTVPADWPLIVAFGSGMTALAFEVVWFRVLVLVFGSTVYSFSAMLSVFLLGLALGSILLGPLADRVRQPVRLLVLTQSGVALFAILGSLMVNSMPILFLQLIRAIGLDFGGMNRTKLLLSLITLLPAAIAFGGTFPIAVRLTRQRENRTGSRIGRVYAWNTVGAIVGSFGAGFLLLPTLGAERTLQLVVAVSLVLAIGSLLAEPGPVRLRWGAPAGVALVLLAAGLAFAPRWDRRLLGAGAYFEPRRYFGAGGEVLLRRVVEDYTLMTYTEGYNDTIISFQSPKGKFITVNGSATASDHFEDMFSQRMLGHLPMALHPGPVRSACIVGLGAGVTAGAIGLYEVEQLTAVELEQGVFEASRFFAQENHHVLDNPVVRVRIDDGRNFLKLTGERYDVISSAPNFPSLTGSGALYSREYFELCRQRLAPGGVMCQFAPVWRLRPSEVHTIMASFHDVFPHVRGFSGGISVVLLGREEPFPPVDFAELERRVNRPAVAASLREIGVRGPVELMSFYQFDEGELTQLAGAAPRNTDDRPRIEFSAPKGLFAGTVGPNLLQIRDVRPDRASRAERLGLKGEIYTSYLALAAASDDTIEAQIAMSLGRIADGIEIAIPIADSGHAYAGYLVAERAERDGLALQRAGKLEAARERFVLALRYDADRLDSMVGLGYVDIFLERLDEADAVLSEAAERFPRSAAALYRLGLVRELQEDLEAAESLYRRATELQPILPKPHVLLGRLLLATGRPEEGLAELNLGIERGDHSEGAQVGRVEALLRLDDERALAVARETARLLPASARAFELLAAAAEASGRPEEASSARERARELARLEDRPDASSSDGPRDR